MAEEHRELDALFAEVQDALRSGIGSAARDALEQLSCALEAHFDREGRLYYPSIWALRPRHKPLLSALAEAHEGLMERLREVRARIEREPLEDARSAFVEFARAFTEHECAEEDLLRALDSDLDLGALEES